MTIEMTRMISDESTCQVPRRLNEIESSLNSQIQEAISTAIAEKVLPFIQNTLNTQGRAYFTVMDRKFSGLQGSPEAGNFQEVWDNCPKLVFTLKKQRHTSRESSVDSHTSEQNRDIQIMLKKNGLSLNRTTKFTHRHHSHEKSLHSIGCREKLKET